MQKEKTRRVSNTIPMCRMSPDYAVDGAHVRVLRIDLHSLEVHSLRQHEYYHADNASTHPNAVCLIRNAPSALPQPAIQNQYYSPISEYSRRSYSALTALTAVSQD